MLGMKVNTEKSSMKATRRTTLEDGQLTSRGRKPDGVYWIVKMASSFVGHRRTRTHWYENYSYRSPNNIRIKTGQLGEEHKGRFVSRIRNEGLEHASIIDSKKDGDSPPSWWVRWIKRDPSAGALNSQLKSSYCVLGKRAILHRCSQQEVNLRDWKTSMLHSKEFSMSKIHQRQN